MNCYKCDNGKDAAFQTDTYPCAHCDEENLVEYNLCPSCGWMWRSVNGTVIEGSEINIQDLGDFANDMPIPINIASLNPADLSEDEQAILDNIGKHLTKINKMEKGEASMSDYVHKCLQCSSTAVDVDNGIYKCTDCSFEWEVVKFE